MKKLVSLFLVGCILFSLCSCATTLNKLQFRTGVFDSVTSLDPLQAFGDGEKIVSANCFEGLLRLDAQGKIDLGGATAYSISKDNLVYTFKLNPAAKWYISKATETVLTDSGIKNFDKKITADDYIYGIIRFAEANNTQLNNIKGLKEYLEADDDQKPEIGAEAVDEHTLRITLTRKDPDFLYKLATLPVYPCNRAFCDALDIIYGSNEATIITNGPYFVSDINDSDAIIERNPDYTGKLQVKNNSVLLHTTGKRNTFVSRFEEGKYDVYLTPSENKLADSSASCTTINSTWGIAFNQKTDVGKNTQLRHILLSSIDYDKIKLPAFSVGKAQTIIPENYLIGDSAYGDFTPKALAYTNDNETALANLEKLLSKSGKSAYTVSVSIPAPMEETIRTVIESWETLFEEKILFDIRIFDLDDTDNILSESGYDMAILPLEATTKTAFGMINAVSGAPCFYKDKKITALTTNLKNTNEENAVICGKIEKHLVDNGIFIPLFYSGSELYLNSGIKDVYIADGGSLMYFHAGTKPES